MSNQNRFLLPHQPTSFGNTNQLCGASSLITSNVGNENQLSVDDNFDSYWEEEARNPHRNRIRIGRQYQATVPQLLKPGERDPRRLEELETLSFCPNKSAKMSDAELDHYFTVTKSLYLFASLVETRSLLGRDVTIADLNRIRHKEGLSLASVIQPNRHSNNSYTSSQETFTPNLMRALSDFISLHHPCHHDSNCQKLLKGEEVELFSKALELCGKNFGSIKKEFLPSKSVRSIVEYYYIGSRETSDGKKKSSQNIELTQDVAISKNVEVTQDLAVPKNVDRMSVYNFDDEIKDDDSPSLDCPCPGAEVKPLKAKPILPNTPSGSEASNSNVGSLKFFMDGQLVLKLNACQEQQKCHWVQSGEIPGAKRDNNLHSNNNSNNTINQTSNNTTNHTSNNNSILSNPWLQQANSLAMGLVSLFPHAVAGQVPPPMPMDLSVEHSHSQKPMQTTPKPTSRSKSKPKQLTLDKSPANHH